MSQARLADLYSQVYALRDSSDPGTKYSSHAGDIPAGFEDINPVVIRLHRSPGPLITLAGCMDEYIYLRFYGDEEEPRIVLTWAEGNSRQAKQILWPLDIGKKNAEKGKGEQNP